MSDRPGPRRGATAALALAATLVAAATHPIQQAPSFPTGTELVLLDMVVRDKNGRPVEDLRRDEVQVLEDGVACPIRSFRLVRSEPLERPASPPESAPSWSQPADAPASGSTMLLVFDRLGVEAAHRARAAAFDLVSRPSLWDAFRSAISEANRSNVVIYALGARGLESPYQASEPGQRIGSTGVLARQRSQSFVVGDLEALAEDTGGFLIANTNDLRPGLARAGEELRRYYEMAYAPANPATDGRFRSIQVKLSRPGVNVRTRRGYYALPAGTPAFLPHELALIEALELPTLPRAFVQRVATLHLAGNEPEVSVLVQVPLAGLRFTRAEPAGTYRAHLARAPARRADDRDADPARVARGRRSRPHHLRG